VVCVELEAKFVELAEQNFKIHDDAWIEFGHPRPIIIQGDSRKLCELVESADIIVSSPPFQESSGAMAKPETYKGFQHVGSVKHKDNDTLAGYGKAPGQLGAMKPGKVDMVISSPPYAECQLNKVDTNPERMMGGTCAPTSHGGGKVIYDHQGSDGNLGNLKAGDVDVILSSPPYENSIQTNGDGIDWTKLKEGGTRKTQARAAIGTGFGKSKGQLAEEQGGTFWQAAKEIVQQCYQILRPGGHAIFVCKDFVRKGQRVPFSDDWQKLCESVGFKTLHRHKAMLVKETKYESLFGHDIVKTTERKSFFRRLAEAKGSPKIDWEDVICMIRS
jgi:hypothetical protein